MKRAEEMDDVQGTRETVQECGNWGGGGGGGGGTQSVSGKLRMRTRLSERPMFLKPISAVDVCTADVEF
jgi:hypothetical protein